MRKNEQFTKTVENWTFPKNITVFLENEGIAICSQKLVPWKSYFRIGRVVLKNSQEASKRFTMAIGFCVKKKIGAAVYAGELFTTSFFIELIISDFSA